MKKVISVVLACSLVLALCAACGTKKTEPAATNTNEPEPVMVGGYTLSEDLVVTEEAKAALEKALTNLVGASYEPLALIGTQVVAGTNYKLLCRITPVVPNAESHYGIATVYADLQGNAEITEVLDVDFTVPGEVMPGGWYDSFYAADDYVKTMVEKATEKTVGATYEAVAHLAEQVVAGKNHAVLCRVTPVVPNPESHYSLVTIYENLQGEYELSEVKDFQ